MGKSSQYKQTTMHIYIYKYTCTWTVSTPSWTLKRVQHLKSLLQRREAGISMTHPSWQAPTDYLGHRCGLPKNSGISLYSICPWFEASSQKHKSSSRYCFAKLQSTNHSCQNIQQTHQTPSGALMYFRWIDASSPTLATSFIAVHPKVLPPIIDCRWRINTYYPLVISSCWWSILSINLHDQGLNMFKPNSRAWWNPTA